MKSRASPTESYPFITDTQNSLHQCIMKSPPPSARPPSCGSLKAISYEDTKAAKPPIPITSARFSPPSAGQQAGLRRPIEPASPQPSPYPARLKLPDGVRRDSGLAPSTTITPIESRTTLGSDLESVPSPRESPNCPRLPYSDDGSSIKKIRKWGTSKGRSAKEKVEDPAVPHEPSFMRIATEIPTGSFEDLTMPGKLQFSKRGSMLIGGQKANQANGSSHRPSRLIGSRRILESSTASLSSSVPSRALSADDEILSHKVRSLYEGGSDRVADWAGTRGHRSLLEEVVGENLPEAASYLSPPGLSHRKSLITLEENELAGGIEDWEDINSGDVDRYGFIVQRKLASQRSSVHSTMPEPTPRIQRMSTSLQIASETPRRHRSAMGRRASTRNTPRSITPLTMTRSSSKLRPRSSQSFYHGSTNGGLSKLRSATNLLPHNKDRKIMDEASDMLTLPPGVVDVAESEEASRGADESKKKEWEREEKWRKMAKQINTSKNGGGMTFEFDTKSPKVIERTWKGIPDRWRATAWHAFLSASAKKRKGSVTDYELIATFQQLVNQGSPDDVQIDIDVPRTINSHIMFRRRYRGGQRLLFRVLHCLSIYFPNTGYVQGMAALAATLLCYFDEEMTFVMLVRLWQLRGLEHLYEPGFGGLMLALEEFEKTWLGNGELAAKLIDLGISPTVYGTRWYLTLFNYSIPFPAQLRVWDVFMLLGDSDPPLLSPPPQQPQPISSSTSPTTSSSFNPTPTTSSASNPTPTTSSASDPTPTTKRSFNGGLDVLHAVSAALVDGTREILLDSDFENAMKVLTSWIPVRDEELLMKVAKAEWKLHRKRR